jgi:hypothetical protein
MILREFAQVPDRGEASTFVSVAKSFGVNEKSLWNWYNMGSRLIHLAGGGECLLTCGIIDAYHSLGTFYILLVVAALDMKSKLLNRATTFNFVVDSLAFAL